MKKNLDLLLLRSLIIPVFLLTMLLLPLLFILIKRYFSMELIPFSLVNGTIMTGGLLINIFVFRQLSGKLRNGIINLLLILSSAGFSLSTLLYISINHPFFFLYGVEVLVSYILMIFIIITSLSLFSSGFFHYQNLISIEREEKETEKQLREEMERQIYSSKINPHFLFNSLNLMVSLLDDKDKAEDVLIRLSELLRYNLEASKLKYIPLNKELESIKKYLYIQKERFGKRLSYEIRGNSEREIPPLLLQPLVENSIKHNLDKGESIVIDISVKEVSGFIKLSVIDSKAALKPEMIGKGTGLEVTKRRTELSGGSFTINRGGVELCLPIR